jgi:single-strand DNA-binding protein
MANLNRVILAGNLTRDPQLSYTPNNTAVCKFGMAINRRWTDRQSGERRDETCFVEVTAFGRSAETINQYMSKGRGILVEGRLQFSQWTNPEGQKRSKLEVVAENFQFLGGRGENMGPRPERSAGAGAAASRDASADEPPTTDDDGIPF